MKTKIIKGRGKIFFYDENDREKMEKKYSDIEFNKMNLLTFTTTYKGNMNYDLKIKVGNKEIPCSFKKSPQTWKYGTKVELRVFFKDLKKKAIIHITGGIQGKLFQFFRYDLEKILGTQTKKKGGAKKTFKSERKEENKEYYACTKKARNPLGLGLAQWSKQFWGKKDKNTIKRSLIKCNNKRRKTLKSLERKYPEEWKEYLGERFFKL